MNDPEYQKSQSAFKAYCNQLQHKNVLPLTDEQANLKQQNAATFKPSLKHHTSEDGEFFDLELLEISHDENNAAVPSSFSPNTSNSSSFRTSSPDQDRERSFISPQHSSASDDSDEEYRDIHLLNPEKVNITTPLIKFQR